MPCEPITEHGKVTGWICRRSREKPKPPVCYKCGKPATRFCDYRDCGARTHTDDYGRKIKTEWASIGTCDRPMCDACAHHYGEDTDFCDEHNTELARYRTAKAERIHKEQLKRLGIEEEPEEGGHEE